MISKAQIDKNNFLRNYFLVDSAREGWELVLSGLKNDEKILLPSYIGITEREGSGIFDPVSKLEIPHHFYSLTDDLEIEMASLFHLIEEGDFSLILIVHYFGFRIANYDKIISFCKSKGLIVVEDCAHLYNFNINFVSNAGELGDYVFYSLHKFFPIEFGGILKINKDLLGCINDNNIPFKKELLKVINQYDVPSIVEKRINNFKYYEKSLLNFSWLKQLKKLNKNDIPHNFPVRVDNGNREKLYFFMLEKGIPLIALYYRLIDPLNTNENINLMNLSCDIINFPVHQDIEKSDIDYIISALEQFNIE